MRQAVIRFSSSLLVLASLVGRALFACVRFWSIHALGEIDFESPDQARRRRPWPYI